MNRTRSYVKLLEALKEPECPIFKLVLEDSRTYLDHLLYEMVLDVPTRMALMESFGFCSWHARQIPTLDAICAPSIGYSIFASDLLRKLDYLDHAVIHEQRGLRVWNSWFRRKHGRFLSLIKAKPCPVCDHVRQFESYHLKDLLDFLGDTEFFDIYKAAQGLCLPHFFILEEGYGSHTNFPLLLELQLAKASSLRNTLEELIRKQDFRLRSEITREEATSWRRAMAILTGNPGVFTNEMGHDLFQRSRQGSMHYGNTILNGLPTKSYKLQTLIDEFRISAQATFYLKKPIPSELFDAVKTKAEEHAGLAMEAVVEEVSDTEYLRKIHSAGFSIFYGIGLPDQTIILLDRKRGFLIEENPQNLQWRPRLLKNARDVYLALLWHRFGIAVLATGRVKEIDEKRGLFCVTNGTREQWCRFRDAATSKLPDIGATVEFFGWEKWNTRIVEVLELKEEEVPNPDLLVLLCQ
jgi:Family of unknown function (DUF6062)